MSTKYITDMYNMMQSGNMQKKIGKPHMHIIITQMSVKEGIKKLGNK